MARCFTLVTTALLFSLATTLAASAQNLPDRVLGYFPGKWENTGGPNGAGSVNWKLVADGKALAGPGMTVKAGASFAIGGWDAKKKVWVHRWFLGDGSYGMTELSKFENDTFMGKTEVVSGDGSEMSGDFRIVTKGKNKFTIETTSNGETSTAEWTRVIE